MRTIEHIYVGGQFVEPHGHALFDLHNPTTGEVIGRVRLGDYRLVLVGNHCEFTTREAYRRFAEYLGRGGGVLIHGGDITVVELPPDTWQIVSLKQAPKLCGTLGIDGIKNADKVSDLGGPF